MRLIAYVRFSRGARGPKIKSMRYSCGRRIHATNSGVGHPVGVP